MYIYIYIYKFVCVCVCVCVCIYIHTYIYEILRSPIFLAIILLSLAQVAHPDSTMRASFDITVECSGNPAALQAAIESARDGGKVVVASWYGNRSVPLQLGTRFHRSHLNIVASQVRISSHASVSETLLTAQTRLVLQTATYRRMKRSTQTDMKTSTP